VGECPRALRWLYYATLILIIVATAQYVYQASERPPRKKAPGSEP
jgi:hypothetical protein